MTSEKEWLDTSIARLERAQELIEKKLKLYRQLRDLRTHGDQELKRLIDEDLVVSSVAQATVDSLGNNTKNDTRIHVLDATAKQVDVNPTEKSVDEKRQEDDIRRMKLERLRELRRQQNESQLSTQRTQQDEQGKSQIRGNRNPNRLLILELTTGRGLTVPQIQKELAARGHGISKQGVSNWVNKLLEQGLLEQVQAEDPAAKYAFQRTNKPDQEIFT